MTRNSEATEITNANLNQYEPPTLMVVGRASEVVLGPPGGGYDGPHGMTFPGFEFEDDGE
ncbi:MAG TPA: lasso RiPP family leader peptide-containing protein [Vicinamibacterales bacterium]|nr:lasso RiPP family leader peptide-containing protein [Vicinamibacterales bacterium]